MTCKPHTALFDGLEHILDDISQDLSEIEKELENLRRRHKSEDQNVDNAQDTGRKGTFGVFSFAPKQGKMREQTKSFIVLGDKQLSEACLLSLTEPCVCVPNLPGRVVRSGKKIQDYVEKIENMKDAMSTCRSPNYDVRGKLVKPYSKLVHEINLMDKFLKHTMSDIMEEPEDLNQTLSLVEFGDALCKYVNMEESCKCCAECVWVLRTFYHAATKQILLLQQICVEQRSLLLRACDANFGYDLYFHALRDMDNDTLSGNCSLSATKEHAFHRSIRNKPQNSPLVHQRSENRDTTEGLCSAASEEDEGGNNQERRFSPFSDDGALAHTMRRSNSTNHNHQRPSGSQRPRAKSVSAMSPMSTTSPGIPLPPTETDKPVYAVYTDFLGPLPRSSPAVDVKSAERRLCSEQKTATAGHVMSPGVLPPRVSTATLPRTAVDDLSYNSYTVYMDLAQPPSIFHKFDNSVPTTGSRNTMDHVSQLPSMTMSREPGLVPNSFMNGTNASLLTANETRLVKSCGINVIHRARKFLNRWSDTRQRKKTSPRSKVMKNVTKKLSAMKPSNWTRETDGTQWREIQTTRPKTMLTVIPCSTAAETSSFASTYHAHAQLNNAPTLPMKENHPSDAGAGSLSTQLKLSSPREGSTQVKIDAKPPMPNKPQVSKPLRIMKKIYSESQVKFDSPRPNLLRLPLSSSCLTKRQEAVKSSDPPSTKANSDKVELHPRPLLSESTQSPNPILQGQKKKVHNLPVVDEQSLESLEAGLLLATPPVIKSIDGILSISDGDQSSALPSLVSFDIVNSSTSTEVTRTDQKPADPAQHSTTHVPEDDCRGQSGPIPVSASADARPKTFTPSVMMSTPKYRHLDAVLDRNSITQKHLKLPKKQVLFTDNLQDGGNARYSDTARGKAKETINSKVPSTVSSPKSRAKDDSHLTTRTAGSGRAWDLDDNNNNSMADLSVVCTLENITYNVTDSLLPSVSMMDSIDKMCLSSFINDDLVLERPEDLSGVPKVVGIDTKGEKKMDNKVVTLSGYMEATDSSSDRLYIDTSADDEEIPFVLRKDSSSETSLTSTHDASRSSASSAINVTYVLSPATKKVKAKVGPAEDDHPTPTENHVDGKTEICDAAERDFVALATTKYDEITFTDPTDIAFLTVDRLVEMSKVSMSRGPEDTPLGSIAGTTNSSTAAESPEPNPNPELEPLILQTRKSAHEEEIDEEGDERGDNFVLKCKDGENVVWECFAKCETVHIDDVENYDNKSSGRSEGVLEGENVDVLVIEDDDVTLIDPEEETLDNRATSVGVQKCENHNDIDPRADSQTNLVRKCELEKNLVPKTESEKCESKMEPLTKFQSEKCDSGCEERGTGNNEVELWYNVSSDSEIDDVTDDKNSQRTNHVLKTVPVCVKIPNREIIERLKREITLSDISSDDDWKESVKCTEAQRDSRNVQLVDNPDSNVSTTSNAPSLPVSSNAKVGGDNSVPKPEKHEPMDISLSISKFMQPVRNSDRGPGGFRRPEEKRHFPRRQSNWNWNDRHRQYNKSNNKQVPEQGNSNQRQCNAKSRNGALPQNHQERHAPVDAGTRIRGLKQLFNLYPYMFQPNVKESEVRHLINKHQMRKLDSPLFEDGKFEISKECAEKIFKMYPNSPKNVARELVYRAFTIEELYNCKLARGPVRKRTSFANDHLNPKVEEAVKVCFLTLFPYEEFYWYTHCVPYVNNAIGRFFRCFLRKPAFRFLFRM